VTEANEKVEDEVAYEKKWYIIHTYSGYEKKVAADLEKRIESLDLTDRAFLELLAAFFNKSDAGGVFNTNVKLLSAYTVISTGITNPILSCV